MIFNASDQPIEWQIPGPQWSRRWTIDLDTSDPKRGSARTVNKRPGDTLDVVDRSMVVLRSTRAPSRHPAHARPAGRRVGTLPDADTVTVTDESRDVTIDNDDPTT